MALAAEPTPHGLSGGSDINAMDIDIDMDLGDEPVVDEVFQLEEGEEAEFTPSGIQAATDTAAIIPEIYNEKPEEEAQWWKIHLRGTDELSTDDLLALIHHYAPDADVHIQWVNDTAANVVCKGSNNMQSLFLKLVDADLEWAAVAADPFALRLARQHPSRPASMLQMRVAQAGDRKKKNAAVESRYYLLHPGEDPTERMRQEFNSNRGEYRRRRGDDREQRRRRDADLAGAPDEFSASMYDDAPSAAADQPISSSTTTTTTTTTTQSQSRGRDLFSRVTRRRSASPRLRNADEIDVSDSEHESRPRARRKGYRDRTQLSASQNTGKELFSSSNNNSRAGRAGCGSSSSSGRGLRSDDPNTFPTANSSNYHNTTTTTTTTNNNNNNNNNNNGAPSSGNGPRLTADSRAENAAVAKRLKADLLSAAQVSPRSNHRRSHAMDAKNEEDLAERFARKNLSIDSTRSHGSGNSHGNPSSSNNNNSNSSANNKGIELFPSASSTTSSGNLGFSIKGAAQADQGLLIKGVATSSNRTPELSIRGRAIEAKELFPHLYAGRKRSAAGNEGKELFDQPVREKRVRRRAGDLFD